MARRRTSSPCIAPLVPNKRLEPVYGDVVRQSDEQGAAVSAEGMRGRVIEPYGSQMEGAMVPREHISLP